MNREQRIWLVLFCLGGLGLLGKAMWTESGVATVYIAPVGPMADGVPVKYVTTLRSDPQAQMSLPRTIGVWVAAFFTLAILSYVYRDNVFYKLTEAIIVGVSAAYLMVVGFWDSIVADLMLNLAPQWTQSWALPAADPQRPVDWFFVVPLILGLMLFLRFVPRLEWVAQWPVAFVVGTFAGLRLILFLESDFVAQIDATVKPLVVISASGDVWTSLGASLRAIGLFVCVLACLSYFIFTVPHRGWLGRSSRLGVWVLMISFGASFAFTVMGRITLLTNRLEFLFRDWLHLL